MSTPQDILNTIIVIGFLVITGCIVFITYFLVKALKSISALADSLQTTSENIRGRIQMRALAVLPALIVTLVNRIFKRGR